MGEQAVTWLAELLSDWDRPSGDLKPDEPASPPVSISWTASDLIFSADKRMDPRRGLRPQAMATPASRQEDCPTCGGDGSVSVATDVHGKPDPEGRYHTAWPCSCFDLEQLAKSFNRIALPPEYFNATVETTDWDHPGASCVRGALEAFVEGWAPGAPGLMLCGGNGVGKGHAAAIACRAIALREPRIYGEGERKRRPVVRCAEWGALVDMVKASFGGGPTEEEVLAPFISCDLLWIDELGKGQRTEWMDALSERLLCRRLDTGGTTIITTNLALFRDMVPNWKGDDLRDYIGHRAASRVAGGCTAILMEGPDFRRFSRG